jgi:hypothetical protein
MVWKHMGFGHRDYTPRAARRHRPVGMSACVDGGRSALAISSRIGAFSSETSPQDVPSVRPPHRPIGMSVVAECLIASTNGSCHLDDDADAPQCVSFGSSAVPPTERR